MIFKDITSFGTNAQVQAEAPLFPGDSETNPLNNSIATAYEVAEMVAFLARASAGSVTGQAMVVDGGASTHA